MGSSTTEVEECSEIDAVRQGRGLASAKTLVMTTNVRNAFVLLAAIIIVAASGVATAAPMTPHLQRWNVEEFYADFEYREEGRLVAYMVLAELVRDADSGKVIRQRVYAGKVPCKETAGGGADCGGRLERHELVSWKSNTEFSRAALVFALNGHRNKLRFVAGEPYRASGTEQGARCYGPFLYEAAYNAYVTGRLLGRRVDTRTDADRSLEMMERYVRLAACT